MKYNNTKGSNDNDDMGGDSDADNFNEEGGDDRQSEETQANPLDSAVCVLAVPPEVMNNESIIEEARQHVNDAKVMREYANMKMKEARELKAASPPWGQSKDCLVADYCQNMSLPHQGMTQPGDTYYFSPLTINCFGTADTGFENPKMRAYVYDEGTAKKGGNNVASLLYKDIHERGWIDKEQGPREELTVIMDNCAGQNKNKMVMRMFAWLVETGAYERINIAFLVSGHTKNVCDRLFNILKLTYRKINVYTFNQLTKVLNTAEDVVPVPVRADEFHDWDAFEDSIYKQITSGTVYRTHLFQFNAKQPGILLTKDTAAPNSTQRQQQLVKKMNTEERAAIVANYKDYLHTLQTPGIKPIKQYELWHKWRPYVPAEYQDILCPRPCQEIINSIKKNNAERGQKAAAKKKGAKRQRSDTMKDNNEPAKGTTVPQMEESTQNVENDRDDGEPSLQMSLDSITTTLNAESPS